MLEWVAQWISEGSGPGGAISVCVCLFFISRLHGEEVEG